MKAPALDYVRPASLQDAVNIIAEAGADAKVLSGGQSLGPMLNLRLARPALLVDISRLEALRRIEPTDDGLSIGAAVTHAEIEDGIAADAGVGLVRHVAGQIAYRAVRNRGTIGGSLAHADPAGDWAPAALALGASATIQGKAGTRDVKVSDLIEDVLTTAIGDDEILVAVTIPNPSSAARWGHYKFTRKPGKFAEAIAVLVRDPDRATARAAIARPAAPPRLMERTAAAIQAANGWSDTLDRDIRDAVAADLDADGERDPIQRRYHMVTMARAARGAFDA